MRKVFSGRVEVDIEAGPTIIAEVSYESRAERSLMKLSAATVVHT